MTQIPPPQSAALRNPMLIAVGGIMAVAGVIIGLVPLGDRGDSCGSVFAPQSWGTSILGGICKTKLMNIAPLAWGLLILGIIVLLWGLRKRAPKPVSATSTSSAPGTPSVTVMPPVKKSAQMDDLIALKDAGTLNTEQFQAAKNRILGKSTPESDQKAKLNALHASGVLSDSEYLAAVNSLE